MKPRFVTADSQAVGVGDEVWVLRFSNTRTDAGRMDTYDVTYGTVVTFNDSNIGIRPGVPDESSYYALYDNVYSHRDNALAERRRRAIKLANELYDRIRAIRTDLDGGKEYRPYNER